MRWSYTRLGVFEQCRLRFWWEYVAKDFNREKSPALQKGIDTHNHFEARLRLQTELPWDWRRWERVCAAIDQYPVRLVEHPITLDINLNVCEDKARHAWFTMNLDVAVMDGGSDARVIDWKTGKVRVTPQLELYADGLMAQWPQLEKVTSSFVWLEKDPLDEGSVTNQVWTRKGAEQRWEKLRERTALYNIARERNDWSARPGWWCRWCPLRPEQCVHKVMES